MLPSIEHNLLQFFMSPQLLLLFITDAQSDLNKESHKVKKSFIYTHHSKVPFVSEVPLCDIQTFPVPLRSFRFPQTELQFFFSTRLYYHKEKSK